MHYNPNEKTFNPSQPVFILRQPSLRPVTPISPPHSKAFVKGCHFATWAMRSDGPSSTEKASHSTPHSCVSTQTTGGAVTLETNSQVQVGRDSAFLTSSQVMRAGASRPIFNIKSLKCRRPVSFHLTPRPIHSHRCPGSKSLFTLKRVSCQENLGLRQRQL